MKWALFVLMSNGTSFHLEDYNDYKQCLRSLYDIKFSIEEHNGGVVALMEKGVKTRPMHDYVEYVCIPSV